MEEIYKEFWQLLLDMAKEAIRIAKCSNRQNDQFTINCMDELNKLSVEF